MNRGLDQKNKLHPKAIQAVFMAKNLLLTPEVELVVEKTKNHIHQRTSEFQKTSIPSTLKI
jgi:hypothetical protein